MLLSVISLTSGPVGHLKRVERDGVRKPLKTAAALLLPTSCRKTVDVALEVSGMSGVAGRRV